MKWIVRANGKDEKRKKVTRGEKDSEKAGYLLQDRKNNPHLYPVTWSRVTWLRVPEQV